MAALDAGYYSLWKVLPGSHPSYEWVMVPSLWVSVAPRLRGPERPVYQPRDQVFWYTALLDIELNNFLLTEIGVHEIYYNASGDTSCSSASLSSTPSSRTF